MDELMVARMENLDVVKDNSFLENKTNSEETN